MSSNRQVLCWVVTSGVAGMENQCLGLAEALGARTVVKRIRLRSPWRQLVPFLRCGLSHAFAQEGDVLAPPWPDVVIASGRVGAAACLYVRRASARSGGRTATVYIQNPVIDPSRFDLVIAPRHDGLLGDNVMTTRGALHRVTPELLAREAKTWLPRFSGLPSPLISVAIGGSNSVYSLTSQEMASIAQNLAALARETGGSLLITPSRRTGSENCAVLKESLAKTPHFLWDRQGENPYYGMLALGEILIVTADSVNMASEACSTGKPVFIIPLHGGSEKFQRFHQTLRDDGMTRPFAGRMERWAYQPLDDVALAAARVREVLARSSVQKESAKA